jgi:hypothetical protein
MSYSFSAQAATKADLKTKVAEQLAAVVLAQPVHAADQSQAQAAADAFIDLLSDDPTAHLTISVSGSCWAAGSEKPGLNQAGVNISAMLATRVP